MHFLFIGERRSQKAIQYGWTWDDGRLASKTLQDALTPLGLTYGTHYTCTNILDDQGVFSTKTMWLLRCKAQDGLTLVSMGKVVDRTLTAYDIPHLQIIHPAARGAIRKCNAYQAHVSDVLSPHLHTSK